MNKSELIEKIAANAGLTKADSKKALDATLAAIKDALAADEKVALVGFGTFAVSERPAREGINPATKEKIQIAAKKVAKLKAGAELKAVLGFPSADINVQRRFPVKRAVPFFATCRWHDRTSAIRTEEDETSNLRL